MSIDAYVHIVLLLWVTLTAHTCGLILQGHDRLAKVCHIRRDHLRDGGRQLLASLFHRREVGVQLGLVCLASIVEGVQAICMKGGRHLLPCRTHVLARLLERRLRDCDSRLAGIVDAHAEENRIVNLFFLNWSTHGKRRKKVCVCVCVCVHMHTHAIRYDKCRHGQSCHSILFVLVTPQYTHIHILTQFHAQHALLYI